MADVSVPAFRKRTNVKAVRKRPATPPPEDSDSDSDLTDDEEGIRVKRRKKEGIKIENEDIKHTEQIEKRSSAFEADRSTTIAANEDATKTSNWYSTGAKPDGKQVGPVKAPTNVRMITVTDFAPDVCKDYKQTGFCGFGDSCKFLHAREDYKQGWQLDKEWEKAGKSKDKAANSKSGEVDYRDNEDKMLEHIPFKCIICREDYKRPVSTRCGHYFCEKCAMTRYMKEKKKQCANCGADTGGTFNVARKLSEILEKKKAREIARREIAREESEKETEKI
ncbi:hypothetical protein M433DRAFT_151600 [Acidomyces richmondensis BFW]|nr:MAG: hypothetical protein FE78DRAFT_85591 [Acidomyces sp. 'richmondensis']KYG48005.1 hypothetical protein M433DRAFT_151600 [Acidomyces richmondensis BFW]